MFCAWVSRSASLRAVPAPGDCWLVRKYRSAGAAQAWIERVAKGVTEEVESEHRAEDRESGTDAHPPLEVRQVTDRVVDVLSPRGEGRLRPEAEERQGRLGEDRERGRERRLHDQSVGDVREDVPHHDTQRRCPDGAGGDDELARTYGENLTPREPRVRRDRDDADRDHGVLDLRHERRGDREREPGKHQRPAEDHARVTSREVADRARAIGLRYAEDDGKGGFAHAVAAS